MVNSLCPMFVWQLLCLLASTCCANPHSNTSAGDDGICKSRVEIYGYECEEHTVTTKDGYILSVQRIHSGNSTAPAAAANNVPILLQHGLFMDGTTWLLSSPNESLGYILADRGYDVWISNSRGTNYSRRHAFLSAHDPVYWDWSWDELAAYDLPSTVEYVHQKAQQQKIHYVGHSLGTLIALASFSQMKLASMLRSATLLSPIAYLDHVRSPLARGAADYLQAYHRWGLSELLPTGGAAGELVTILCAQPAVDCHDLMSALTGKNCCLNSSSVQLLQRHGPQPTSTKNGVHMSQMMQRGTITKYDYNNVVSNMIHYGQASPPAYNMSDIPKDLHLFLSYGGQDELSDVADVERLLDRLKAHDHDKLVVQYHENYAHLDFVMAVNAKQVIYDPLMDFFQLQGDL